MIERMFDYERRGVANHIHRASERLRERARRATPGVWRAVPTDGGGARIIGRDGEEVAVATGAWASGTALYLATVDPHTSYIIAELMWRCEAPIRRGELPSPIAAQLRTLAAAILAE
ncbi:hypothetical protein SAMN05661093_03644 [Kibdelosporangium aridum]|uniref:Uncharacterized protein n=2 Tax=Kibdelosporangium aridum TaxID=2030 RepID=A0A1W2DNV7_KIBAR|nr:hypothetical protein SAMN05661093_03644 [Kibdelosporangium aridum]